MSALISYLDLDGSRNNPLNDIKAWLRGHVNQSNSDFFSRSPPFHLVELQMGLCCAVQELISRLDPDLQDLMEMAASARYNIDIESRAFYLERKIDVEGLMDKNFTPIDRMTRPEVMRELEAARAEIIWMEHEMSRLKCHMENAVQMKERGGRRSFGYRPSARTG